MLSISSIVMPSLVKIAQCAPAVGATMWCLFFKGRKPAQPVGINFTQCVSGQKSAFSPLQEKKPCTGRKIQKSAKKVCAHHFVLDHSVARQCVHCYKGDAASQWEMAILWVSELRNSWTDRLKMWHTRLHRWVCLVRQISENSAAQGLAGNMVKCTPRVLFIFLHEISRKALPIKIHNNFKILRCSRVGNLGS